MKNEHFDTLWTLFEEAMDVAPADLPSWLDERVPAAGEQAELRRDLEELLAERQSSALDLSPTALAEVASEVLSVPSVALSATGPAPLPSQIGPYRVLRELGRGGMGVVYLARQTSPEREVAIKVLRDLHDPAASVPRFLRESRLLARLQHPGIARVIEADVASMPSATGVAGAETLVPYFAMEYVEGPPLTVFADEHQLDLPARLDLIAKVCDAVEHAHQQGVVHRDLKPGNILVEAQGDDLAEAQPKVLDFGVARCLSSDGEMASLRTRTGQLVGTLPYMSPEQVGADADAVDARSDVYALGVVAHELLTHRLPLDIAGLPPAEAVVVIRDRESTAIGHYDPRLRGDVETIIATALTKEPERRYASAGAFAADIRRHLTDRPILARPASRVYLMGKFARRHRGLVTGVACAMLALVVGIVVATGFAIRADRAAADAEAQGRMAERERARAQNELYAVSLGSAQDAIANADWKAAESYLNLSLPEQRGWEWRHLQSQIPRREAMAPLGARRGVAFRPDGTALAIDLRGDEVVLLDVDRNEVVAAFRNPTGDARHSAHQGTFSGDGTRFATILRRTPSRNGEADEDDLGELIICDTTSGEIIRRRRLRDAGLRSIRLSHNGGLISFRYSDRVACFDGRGRKDAVFGDEPIFVRHGKIGAVAWGPGDRLAVRLEIESEILDGRTGRTITRSRRTRARSFAFSPNGETLAFRGNAEIVICAAATFTPRRRIKDIGDSIRGLRFIDDDRIIYTRNDRWVSVHHLDEERPRTRFPLGMEWNARFAVSPDRREVLIGLERSVARYLIDPDARAMAHDSYGYDVTFHPDGELLATRDFEGAVALWDWKSARRIAEYRGPKDLGSLYFSEDGLSLTSARLKRGKVNMATRNLLTGEVAESKMTEAAYRAGFLPGQAQGGAGARSHDGRLIVWRGPDNHASLMPFADVSPTDDLAVLPQSARRLPEGYRLYCARFSPDGRYLATGHISSPDLAQLYLRDAQTGEIIHSLDAHGAGCMAVSFSPDGTRLVSSGREATVVWDVERGEAIMRLQGHRSYVHGVAFSPDGSALASVSGDRSVRIWDSQPLHERRREASAAARRRAAQEPELELRLRKEEPHEIISARPTAAASNDTSAAERARDTFQMLVERALARRPRLLSIAPVQTAAEDQPARPLVGTRSRHRFELLFDEPVHGLRPEDIALEGGLAAQASIIGLASELGSGAHFSRLDHRALTRDVDLGSSRTIEFWMRRETRFLSATILSYAVPTRTNEIFFSVEGLLGLRDSFLAYGPTTSRLRWQHVAIVIDSETKTARTYTDGRQSLATAIETPPESGGTLVFADDQDAVEGGYDDEQGFLGSLDEIRIWNRVLTPAEIRESRTSSVSADAPGLMHAWSFDEVSSEATRVPDLTGARPLELQNGVTRGEGAPCRRWFVDVEIGEAPALPAGTVELTLGLRETNRIENCAGHRLRPTPDQTERTPLRAR